MVLEQGWSPPRNLVGIAPLPLLRLLQLASPALPIGAFAYSQGVEMAVTLGWVSNRESAAAWMKGLLSHALGTCDVPILARLYAAWRDEDAAAVRRWNDRLFASRGTAELQAEDRQLGAALGRVLSRLDLAGAAAWTADPRVTHAGMFALAAARWEISLEHAAMGYLFAWAEAQVGAATRLVPLGQSDSQRILSELLGPIAAAVDSGLRLGDESIGASAPGHAMASALHETQYSRLFRS